MDWDQLKSIAWLRWRLTRNQWARGGGIGAAIAAVVALGALLLSVTGLFGGVAVGAMALRTVSPRVIMAVWLGLTGGFIFFWFIGLLSELQRSESIDLQRLMHLPVLLGQIFVVNFVASHLALSIAVFVPAMMGVALGLAFSRGMAMLLLIPLALAMVFMITAWTYCLRGWLATLMSNPRRRRTVIVAITLAFVFVAQAPNFYFNVIRRRDRPARTQTAEQRQARSADDEAQMNQLLKAQVVIPPLWVPVGAQALAEGRAWPALLGALGCFGIGALGLRRAYRSTLRFYHGESGGKAKAAVARRPAAAGPPLPLGSLFLERRVPGVPEQAAALALATFRSMMRAPEVKMQWATSFIVTLMVGGSVLFRGESNIPDAAKPFMATGVVVFSLFLLVQFLSNQFGLDRDGFRVLVLSPASRRDLLIGKNLACLPIGVSSGLVLLTVLSIWLRLPLFVFVATVLQLVSGLLIAALGGNLLSILLPYRVQAGSMKPTKMPGLTVLVMVACQLLFPIAMAPAFLPPFVGFLWQRLGGPSAALVNLLLSVVLFLVTAFTYWRTLDPLGRLLQRRETKILAVVTVDVE